MSDAVTLTVAPRFCGPPASANGGYFAGMVAALASGVMKVRLRRPPPVSWLEAVEVAGRTQPALVAAPWIPDASLVLGDGRVAPQFMWAALDCPGYFAVARDGRMMLLAELTAKLERRLRIDEPAIAIGWHLGGEGRVHEAGTARCSARTANCAHGRARCGSNRGRGCSRFCCPDVRGL